MGILDMYKKQYEEDKKNENFDLPENCILESGFSKEDYEKELKTIREKMDIFDVNTSVSEPIDFTYEQDEENDDVTLLNYKKRLNTYTENETNTKDVEVKAIVRRAYCPVCGTEIVNKMPSSFNPYTGEKVCGYKCNDCGHMMNLEYTYPRVVYIDSEGNEINAYGL